MITQTSSGCPSEKDGVVVALMVLVVVGVKAAFLEVNVVEAFCNAFSVGDMSIDSLLLFLMSSVLNVGEIDVPSVEGE